MQMFLEIEVCQRDRNSQAENDYHEPRDLIPGCIAHNRPSQFYQHNYQGRTLENAAMYTAWA